MDCHSTRKASSGGSRTAGRSRDRQLQSGTALDIRANGTTLRAPGNTQRANKTGDAEILGGIGNGELWFDTSVFSLPSPDTFGNMSRNGSGLNNPGYRNIDASIVKKFEVRRAAILEFRADAFNATNSLHPDVLTDNQQTLGNAQFGMTNQRDRSRLMRGSACGSSSSPIGFPRGGRRAAPNLPPPGSAPDLPCSNGLTNAV